MIQKIRRESREEWLKMRKKYIGGSDSAAVVGLNEFLSPYALWCEKCGITPEFEGNLRTEFGSFNEEFVAQWFSRVTGKKVTRSNFSFVNDKYPWAVADIDRFVVGEDAILECKTVNELTLKHYANGDYPARFYCQVQHYMAVLDKKMAYLAVMIGTGRDFRIYEIERNDAEIDALMDAEKQFFEHMQTNTPPPIDGSESTKEAILAQQTGGGKQPEEEPEPLDLTEKRKMLETYFEIDAAIKQLEEQQSSIKNQLMEAMGEAWRGVCEGYSISYKPQERKTFDWKKLQKEHPSLNLGPFFKVSSSRPLNIKRIEKEEQ